jgi:peptidoglycan-associated lipoprotein
MLLKRKWNVIWVAIVLVALVAFSSGCKKKAPPPPPPPPPVQPAPPPPPPPAPDITEFSAEPSTIERGQSSTLKWSVSNATEITIDHGVGTVQASGTKSVFPTETTTYSLRATGAGGTMNKTATVTVTAPPPPPPPPSAPKVSLSERISSLQDAYYDYDKSDIREDARAALTRDAEALKSIFQEFPNAVITVEGHCDERGSAEYNLGLGDRRATSAKDFLVQLGVPADKLKTISYGKERPVCTESNEECWQRNRRAHFSAGQ